MKLRNLSCLALCITAVACASEGGGDSTGNGGPIERDRDTSADTAAMPSEKAEAPAKNEACNPEPRLTPTNLAADTCDTPGENDLTVPAGSWDTLDTTMGCPAFVAQGEGLPDICVYKFANVAVLGTLSVKQFQFPVAIVATGTLTIAGSIETSVFGQSPACFIGGGSGGVNQTGQGGTPLWIASFGGLGCAGGTPPNSAEGGSGGAALQFTSCGELHMTGTIDASGRTGSSGAAGNHAFGPAGHGGGGGGGGTILLEGKKVLTDQNAQTTALAGWGGPGGAAYSTPPGMESYPGGAGGAPGTNGACVPSHGDFIPGCGGSGGGNGVVLVKVPEGVAAPSLTSNPPATFGTVGTH